MGNFLERVRLKRQYIVEVDVMVNDDRIGTVEVPVMALSAHYAAKNALDIVLKSATAKVVGTKKMRRN